MTNKSSTQIGKDAAAQLAQSDEWVYFVFKGSPSDRHRFRRDAADHAGCESYRPREGWIPSRMPVSLPRMLMCDGLAWLTDEDGSPLDETLDVKPAGSSEVTDPATGTTYKLDGNGAILSRAPHSTSFYAAPCNVHIIEAVIRLGLVVVKS